MKYAESNEWAVLEGSKAKVGISKFAKDELGDVVFVDLPQVGNEVKAQEQVCVIESTKAAADIYTPLSGKIISVNEELRTNPEKINSDPEGAGWLFEIEVFDESEYEKLLSQEQYKKQKS